MATPTHVSPPQAINDAIAHTIAYVLAVFLLGILFADGTFGADSDKLAYTVYFDAISGHLGIPEGFERMEPGFHALTWLMASLTNSTFTYFWVIFVIQFIGLTCRIGKRSPLFSDRFYLALLWLAFPFFYSLSLNVLRQGIALVFVLYALDAEITNRRLRSLVMLFGGIAFHASSVIYLPVILALRWRLTSLRCLLAIWFVCVACSAVGLPQQIINTLESLIPASIQAQYPYYFSYLTGQLAQDYDTGFKLRFLLFSSLPLAGFLAVRWLGFRPGKDFHYVLRVYLAVNALFFFFGYIPFSDRIALLSWQLMPILAVGLTPPHARVAASLIAGVAATGILAFVFV